MQTSHPGVVLVFEQDGHHSCHERQVPEQCHDELSGGLQFCVGRGFYGLQHFGKGNYLGGGEDRFCRSGQPRLGVVDVVASAAGGDAEHPFDRCSVLRGGVDPLAKSEHPEDQLNGSGAFCSTESTVPRQGVRPALRG